MMNDVVEVLETARTLHKAARLNAADAKKQIPAALGKVEALSTKALELKNGKLSEWCTSAMGFIEGIGRHETYQTAFAGGLDTLERRAAEL